MLPARTRVLCFLTLYTPLVVVWGQSQKTGTQHLPQTGTKPEPHAAPSTPIPVFEDVAARAGLTASHISSKDKRYVIESMSGGVGPLSRARTSIFHFWKVRNVDAFSSRAMVVQDKFFDEVCVEILSMKSLGRSNSGKADRPDVCN
jgi:hypothetical protein